MSASRLVAFLEDHRERSAPLVLATVYETQGSTYSKPGAYMLIDEDGVFQGMLSGGCLEGDLAIRSQVVIESGSPQLVSYDLGKDNDELWGMGVGCDGLMRILLQPLDADYEPLTTIAATWFGDGAVVAETRVESPTGPMGMTKFSAPQRDAVYPHYEDGVLYSLVRPLPRILLLGAGLDARPVVDFAAALGWRCTVADHRPAYVKSGGFEAAEKTLCCPAGELARQLCLNDFDCAIIMSHHLASDREYLFQLSASDVGYIGLLGPSGRRERLVEEVGNCARRLHGRLHGPAGLDLGGRGPAAIALSIVAEIQRYIADADRVTQR